MEVRIVHDLDQVNEFLQAEIRFNYVYQFNNLAADQWAKVVCFGLFEGKQLRQIAMLNINYRVPVVLAASFDRGQYSSQLMQEIKSFLPAKFYTHIDQVTLEEVFSGHSHIVEPEEYVNMGLCNHDLLDKQTDGIVRLGFEQISDIKELISLSYPEAWLDEELLRLNENFGAYRNGKLISFAGLHAFSEQHQVAAIAHVTTLPEYRNKGYAQQVVAALARSLQTKIEFIGLNVRANNLPAINCYKKLGFKEFGRFMACEIIAK